MTHARPIPLLAAFALGVCGCEGLVGLTSVHDRGAPDAETGAPDAATDAFDAATDVFAAATDDAADDSADEPGPVLSCAGASNGTACLLSGGATGVCSDAAAAGMRCTCSPSGAKLGVYYTFDDPIAGASGTMADYSGGGLAGAWANVTQAAGVIGNAFVFDGRARPGAYATVGPVNGDLSSYGFTTGSRTYCAWVDPNPSPYEAGLPVFANGPGNTALEIGWAIDFFSIDLGKLAAGDSCAGGTYLPQASPYATMEVSPGSPTVDNWGHPCFEGASSIPAKSWSFVCWDYDVAGTTNVYVNGESVTGNEYLTSGLTPQTSYPSVLWSGYAHITIGANTASTPYGVADGGGGGRPLIGSSTGYTFYGRIDEVTLWEAALTPVQVALLYNNGSACPVR